MAATKDEILAALPHAPPFRFVTRLIHLLPDVSAEAMWRVSGDEEFLQGHFPADPIVPGVLIGEALAQVSGLVRGDTSGGAARRPVQGRLAHLDLRFLQVVHPPIEILLRSTLTRSLGRLNQYDVEALVNQQVVARGAITLALDIETALRTEES